jgi:hypothetical protein
MTFHLGNVIIPTEELYFSEGEAQPPTRFHGFLVVFHKDPAMVKMVA